MKSGTRAGLGLALGVALFGAAVAGAQPTMSNQPPSEKLLEAVRDGADGTVQRLVLANSGIVNLRGFDGDTPLMAAVKRRAGNVVDFLLNKGADPKLADGKGEIPLTAAATAGWPEGIERLIAGGANVNGTNRFGETALSIAVQTRNARLVRTLLSYGANPDLRDRRAGYSAREYAKRDTRQPEILRMIEGAKR